MLLPPGGPRGGGRRRKGGGEDAAGEVEERGVPKGPTQQVVQNQELQRGVRGAAGQEAVPRLVHLVWGESAGRVGVHLQQHGAGRQQVRLSLSSLY